MRIIIIYYKHRLTHRITLIITIRRIMIIVDIYILFVLKAKPWESGALQQISDVPRGPPRGDDVEGAKFVRIRADVGRCRAISAKFGRVRPKSGQICHAKIPGQFRQTLAEFATKSGRHRACVARIRANFGRSRAARGRVCPARVSSGQIWWIPSQVWSNRATWLKSDTIWSILGNF